MGARMIPGVARSSRVAILWHFDALRQIALSRAAMRRRRWLPGVVLAVLCVAAAADRGAKAPQRVIQYGPTRTATTLQFQMLCAIMFLVQGDAGECAAAFPGMVPRPAL